MELVILSIVIILGLFLRTVTIYGAAMFLVHDKDKVLPKAAAIGILGGLLAVIMIFIPLGSLLILILDYKLVKTLFDLDRLRASILIISAGLLSQLPIYILRTTVLA